MRTYGSLQSLWQLSQYMGTSSQKKIEPNRIIKSKLHIFVEN